jgi:hypothetical protein
MTNFISMRGRYTYIKHNVSMYDQNHIFISNTVYLFLHPYLSIFNMRIDVQPPISIVNPIHIPKCSIPIALHLNLCVSPTSAFILGYLCLCLFVYCHCASRDVTIPLR